jgi:hypothetical protein
MTACTGLEETLASCNLSEIVGSDLMNELYNPVGELMSIGIRCGLRTDFDFTDHDGPAHSKTFTCEAKMGEQFSESAVGRSKKIAKRLAAIKLLLKVKEDSVVKEKIGVRENGSKDIANCASKLNNFLDKSTDSTNNIDKNRYKKKSKPTMATILKESKNNTAKVILESKPNTLIRVFNKDLLDSFVTEENLSYNIYDFKEMTEVTRKEWVIISIENYPHLTAPACGNSLVDAIQNAAFLCLMQLRNTVRSN